MTTATQSLADFLLARLADDEAVARATVAAADPSPWDRDAWLSGPVDGPGGYAAITISPARVLAEVEAKRAIVAAVAHDGTLLSEARWGVDEDAFLAGADRIASIVLRHLAAPYALHEDFQEGWRA